jgi:hypothetical protein
MSDQRSLDPDQRPLNEKRRPLDGKRRPVNGWVQGFGARSTRKGALSTGSTGRPRKEDGAGQRSRARLITTRWIWLVPS